MIFRFKEYIREEAEFIREYDKDENGDETIQLICDYDDNDARSFGYYNNEMLVGVDKKQWHCYLSCKLRSEGDENNAESYKDIQRSDLKYPGRMWVEYKIITFYIYPPKDELKNVLNDIKVAHDKIRNKKNKIIVYDHGQVFKTIENIDKEIDWSEWRIEVLDIEPNTYWDVCKEGNRPKLIPIKDYVGSSERNWEDVVRPHLLDYNQKQELKKKGWGKGFGSDLTAWDGKNPLAWRQAKYQENKMYDIAEEEILKTKGGDNYFNNIDATLKLPKNIDIILTVFDQIRKEQGEHFNLILTGGFGDWIRSLIKKGELVVPGNLVITNGSIRGKNNRLGKHTTGKEVDIVHKKQDIENQKFILFDDSYYSGSTKKALEEYLKKYGSEIYKTYVLYDGSDVVDAKRSALYRYYDYHSGTVLPVDMLIDYLYSLDIDIPKDIIRDYILDKRVKTIKDVRDSINNILIKFGKEPLQKLTHRETSLITKSFENFDNQYFIENKTITL